MRLILAGALCLVTSIAGAQQIGQGQVIQLGQPVSVPAPLMIAIHEHLKSGGTYSAAQELAREIEDLITQPQREQAREAEIRKKIEDEAKAKEPTK